MTTLSPATTSTTATARQAPRPDMLTYARLDLRRQLRDRFGMFFVVGLPNFMYLVFVL
jgi:ABC-2 type transport system permease protein